MAAAGTTAAAAPAAAAAAAPKDLRFAMMFSDDTGQDAHFVRCGEDYMATQFMPKYCCHCDEYLTRFDGAGCFRSNYTRLMTGPCVHCADPSVDAAAPVAAGGDAPAAAAAAGVGHRHKGPALAEDEVEGLLCFENTGFGAGVFMSRAEIDDQWIAGDPPGPPPTPKYTMRFGDREEDARSKRPVGVFNSKAEVAANKLKKLQRSGGTKDGQVYGQRLASMDVAREAGLLVCSHTDDQTKHVCGQRFILKVHYDKHVKAGKHSKAGGTTTMDKALQIAMSAAVELASGSRPNSARGLHMAEPTGAVATTTVESAAARAVMAAFECGSFVKPKRRAGYTKPPDLVSELETLFWQGEKSGKKVKPQDAYIQMKVMRRTNGQRYFSFRSPHGRLLTVQVIKQWFSSRTAKKNKKALNQIVDVAPSDQLATMKVEELKAELRRRGLKPVGLKAELLATLRRAIELETERGAAAMQQPAAADGLLAAAVDGPPGATANEPPSAAADGHAANDLPDDEAAAPAAAAAGTATANSDARQFAYLEGMEFLDGDDWMRILAVQIDKKGRELAFFYPTEDFDAENVEVDDCDEGAAAHVENMLPTEDVSDDDDDDEVEEV